MESSHSITTKDLSAYAQACSGDPLVRTARNAASKTSLYDICYNQDSAKNMGQKFSLEIPTMAACDQKASGRCWIFAALNQLREQVAKSKRIENFQLSQNYIAFYDHLEKANTFFEHILSTLDRPLSDRYVSRLLSEPVGDGGWWEYFVGLTLKYGAVPQEAMPDTYQSSHSEQMNTVLNMQLRKDACKLRALSADGAVPEDLRLLKQEMLARVYRLLTICLGTPPRQFDFEYVDKDGTYHADRDLTPLGFYEAFIGKDLNEIVSLVNAPIEEVPYYRTCYVKGEESIYGQYPAKRLNLPMEEFKAAVIRQLSAGEPVWFVCDCDYYGSKKEGIWDTELFDYESLLGLDLNMEKRELLNFRQCSLNHAMLLTGVNLVNGKPDRWKVENSWGEDCGEKGYFVISDSWFDCYVFTASIESPYLTETQRELFKQEPLILEPWSVLG